jgi:predicted nucleotidyltransferase
LPDLGIKLPEMGKKSTEPAAPPARRSASRGAVAPVRTSMADALFTTTQQRVLALLFGQPERSFFTKELIELAGGGSGAVQRELGRLQQSGLIAQTRVGNQKHYRADAGSPIFAELLGIVAKTLGPAQTLREALTPLAGQLQLALVYGSAAAGRDTAHSDLDLLLVSDALTLEQVYAALEPAEKQLGRPINPTLYTPSEFRRRLERRNPFLLKLLSRDTMPLIGNKDEFVATG